MTVLNTLPDTSQQPPIDAEEPGFAEKFGAGWTAETIRTDAWSYSTGISERMLGDLTDLLPEESRQRVLDFGRRAGRPIDHVWTLALEEAAQVRDPGLEPAWAGIPATLEERDAMIDRERMAELTEAEAVLGPGFSLAGMAGQFARAGTDPTSLALMPLGTGGTLLKIAAREALWGAFGEAMILPREIQVADELGLARPDPLTRIATGAAVGGTLGTALAALPRFVAYAIGKRAAEAPSRPAGVNELDHRAAIESGRQDLELGKTVRTDEPSEMWRYANAIAAIESRGSGDYQAIGPLTRNGDRAYGRYQVMGSNIGPWTERYFGRRLTPQEFLANTAAQDAVFFGEFGSYLARYGNPQDAASMWFSGRPLRRAGNASDGYTTVPTYVRKFTAALNGADGRAPRPTAPADFAPYRTSRGYTGTGQVMVGDSTRLDVSYEVVDASLLRQASGEFQPRDRARVASDAWVADTAARLDPAQLMPSPTADRGAPLVGPDGMIESGNGRVRAIERAYAEHPDRADAYRQQIEAAGFEIPEGVERPVLIARRTTEIDPAARRQLVVDAQDSGVARMTATERGQIGARALDADLMARYRPDRKLSAAENRDFARAFAGAFPRSERNAFINEQGRISTDGIRQIQDAFFARAWDAPDIVARAVEAEPGQLRSLIDALAEAAPEVAALRADIEAGLVRPEMDITPFILDAARLIIAARDAAGQGQAVADLLEEFLSEVDLLDGAVAPLTQALVRAMMPQGRQAPAKKIADFLKRYAEEARKAGRVGDALGDAPGPLDVLKRMDPEAFGDLTETGTARIREPEPLETEVFPEDAFADGAASPEAEAADALAAEAFAATEAPRIERLADMDPVDAAALDRELKAGQAFRDIDELMERGARNHDELTGEIGRAADEAGATQKVADLKGRDRVEEKIRDKYRGQVNRIADVARGGVRVDTPDMAEAFIEALATRYRVIDEGWAETPVGYFDRKLAVVFDDGQLGEVQIWAPGMLEAKTSAEVIQRFGMPETFVNAAGKVKPTKGGHALYEISRQVSQPAELRARADAAMSELYAEVRDALPPEWQAVLGRQESAGIEAPSRSTTLAKSSSLTSGEPSSAYTSEATIGPQSPSSPSSSILSGSGSTAGMERSTRKNLMGDTSTPDIATMQGLDNTLTIDLPDGTTLSAREILDDLEADETLLTVIDLCVTGRAA